MDVLPLGERIRTARLERHMTQDELARDTFSKSYVSAVELGKIQPSIKALRILARRLQLPASFFLETLEPDIETQQTLLAFSKARVLVMQGDHNVEALAELEKLDYERLNETQAAEAFYLEGRTLYNLQREAESLAKLEESRQQWEDLEEAEWVERVRNLLGEIYFRQRKYKLAQEQHKLCLVAIQTGVVRDVALKLSIYANLALAYSAMDMHDAARALFSEAQLVADTVASVSTMVATQHQITDQYVTDGHYVLARYALEQAEAVLKTVEIEHFTNNLHLVFGQIYYVGHNWAEAEVCYQAALNGLTFQPPVTPRLNAITSLANLYLRQNRIDDALQAANQALALQQFSESDNKQQSTARSLKKAAGQIRLALARISEEKKEPEEADKYFAEALELLKESGETALLSEAYFAYGEALLVRGQSQTGAQYLKLAYEERSRPAS